MECESFIDEAPTCSKNGSTVLKMECQQFELLPLEDYHPVRYLARNYVPPNQSPKSALSGCSGPLKALRLLILVGVLPTLFIAIPLYMRYFVFSGQIYPVGMSDMRLIDKKVSTTWCQRQLLRSNATFNAFLMSSQPKFSDQMVPVTMTRHLSLEDDMKEYWGFYLLQGSIVTVSTCVRWPGASLIMIRGHKHLQECAYIGDDSSEELQEILAANGGKLDEATLEMLRKSEALSNRTNKPDEMIRRLGTIQFHEPRIKNDKSINRARLKSSEEKDFLDTKALSKILGHLYTKQQDQHKQRTSQNKHSHIVNVPELLHRYRETNINEDEGKYLSFKDLETPHESNASAIIFNDNTFEVESHVDYTINTTTIASVIEEEIKETVANETYKDAEATKEESHDKQEEDVELTSGEIFDDVLQKLVRLGKRGKNVLNRLNERLNEDKLDEQSTMKNVPETRTEEDDNDSSDDDKKLDALTQILHELMEEQKAKEKGKKRSWKNTNPRKRRNIMISPAMVKELNEHDEKGNRAIEDGFEADGIADHHHIINETTKNDMSRSEFWSSFSSSEEALLECEGLILNLPLTPHKQCYREASESIHEGAALSNTVTYRVPSNGYYFFVFNSENEIQTNYIRVKFDLQKTIYDLNNATANCHNSTEKCEMPLSFFSSEKVVLEVPVNDNDSLWNEEFVVMSECEPRTSIYLICVIAVPVLIILMAFQ